MKLLPLVFVLSLPVAAIAQSHSQFGTSGEWAIKINPINGNGCYMEKQFDSGSLVQIGAVPDKDGAFFAIYNAAFEGVVDGEVGSVLLDFGDSRFQGEVVGAFFDGLPGGYAFFDNPEFASEFGKRTSVRVQGKSEEFEEIDLSGSMKGLQVIQTCQEEQEAN